MFARRFFPGRYFAPRYFPQSQGEPVEPPAGGDGAERKVYQGLNEQTNFRTITNGFQNFFTPLFRGAL